MRINRNVILAIASIFLVFNLNAQQAVEKTLVKSFNLQGNDVIDLNLKGDIEVKEWNSAIVRVEMLISLENGNEMLLKSLIKAGRYNLHSVETEDAYQISIPGLNRDVTVKGKTLIDKVSYVISVPSEVNIRESEGRTVQIER